MATTQIESMLPGVVYLAASPDSPAFKQPGDTVEAGETIALIEVMKAFMPVEASVSGVFVRYLVEAEAMVEPGDVLCEVEA